MIPFHLTFFLHRNALCPVCNTNLCPSAWTIRHDIAICVTCADIAPLHSLVCLALLARRRGSLFFSESHSILFFTPPAYFPRNVLWHLWITSPAYYALRYSQDSNESTLGDV